MGYYEQSYLMHHGVKGQHWGQRRAAWYPIAAYEKSVANGGTDKRVKGGASSETYRKRADKVSSKKSNLESKNESLNKQKNVYNAKSSQAKVNINTSQNNISRIKNKYAKRDLYDIPHRAKTEKKVSKEESNISKNSEILSKYSALADELQAKIDSNTVKIDKYKTKIDKLIAKADKKEAKENAKALIGTKGEDENGTYTIVDIKGNKEYDWETGYTNNGQSWGKPQSSINKKLSEVDFDGDTVERVKGGSVNPKNYASKVEKIQNSSKTDEAKDRKLAKLDADYARNYYYDSETGETKKGYTGPKYSSILDAKTKLLAEKATSNHKSNNSEKDTGEEIFEYAAKKSRDDIKGLTSKNYADKITEIRNTAKTDEEKDYRLSKLDEAASKLNSKKLSSVDFNGDTVERVKDAKKAMDAIDSKSSTKNSTPKTYNDHIKTYENMTPTEMMKNGRGSKSVDEWEAYDSVAYDKAREAYAASKTAKTAAKKSEAKATAYILEGSVSVADRSNQDIARDLVESGAYANYDSALKWVNKNF